MKLPDGTTHQTSTYVDACPAMRSTAYPNPASDVLNMPEGATNAVLLNDQGKVVRQPDAKGKLDVRTLPAGTYNLRTNQEKTVINQQIQVTH
ncbi:T9SS type A sorting domain-containing protein [Hymenobacter daeguensis]